MIFPQITFGEDDFRNSLTNEEKKYISDNPEVSITVIEE